MEWLCGARITNCLVYATEYEHSHFISVLNRIILYKAIYENPEN